MVVERAAPGGQAATTQWLDIVPGFSEGISWEEEEIRPAGVFIFIGQTPNTAFLEKSQVKVDQWKFIVTGHDLVHNRTDRDGYDNRDPASLETSVPGLFSAMDGRASSTKQVAPAAVEGAAAGLMIREYLKSI